MRLFKSRKSADYSNVSSVVANENDPHVTLSSICHVSCSTSHNQYHWRHNSSVQDDSTSSNLHNNNCNIHHNHFNNKTPSDIAIKSDNVTSTSIDNKIRTATSTSLASSSSTNYECNNNNNNNDVILDKFTRIPECDVEIVSASSNFEENADSDGEKLQQKQQKDVAESDVQTDSNEFLNEILGIFAFHFFFASFSIFCLN